MADLSPLSQRQAPAHAAAAVSIRIGQKVEFDARITSAGLLSIAVLMSGILLGSAVIVAAARRKKRYPAG